LTSYLSKDKLRIIQREFCYLSAENFDLLTRKGIFPYEYIDCVEKLEDMCLSLRESFYSSLTGDTVSKVNYALAVNVWQRFSVRTLGEYSDSYLKTDVLLADIFENFCDSYVSSYGLDPAYYYTLPDFTWDAMSKHTGINFELLTDIDMIIFVERDIRSGLSQYFGRYARANNKYMKSYEPSKPPSYLMYFDVNNLYGWAMCQPLPFADFRWANDISNFNVMDIALDSPRLYSRGRLRVSSTSSRRVCRFIQRTINCPVNEKTSSSRCYMIRNVTSYTIETCSNVLVTAFG